MESIYKCYQNDHNTKIDRMITLNCLLTSGLTVQDGASCLTGRSSMCSRCNTRSTSAKRRWNHNDVSCLDAMSTIWHFFILAAPKSCSYISSNKIKDFFWWYQSIWILYFVFFLSYNTSLLPRRCLPSSRTSRALPTGRWGSTSSSTCQSSVRRLSMLLTGHSFSLNLSLEIYP